jgi:TonB family protein
MGYIRRSKKGAFSSFGVSIFLHIAFVIFMGYYLVIGEGQKTIELTEMIKLSELKPERVKRIHRTVIHREPIRTAPPMAAKTLIKTNRKIDMINQNALDLGTKDIGEIARNDFLMSKSDFVSLRPSTTNFSPPQEVQISHEVTQPEVDFGSNLNVSMPGLSSMLVASPRREVSIQAVETKSLMDIMRDIRRKIEVSKRYPKEAREAGYEGTATVMFQILRDGDLGGVKCIATSGFELLDKAAIATIERAAPFPNLDGYTNDEYLTLRVPIAFNLKESDA